MHLFKKKTDVIYAAKSNNLRLLNSLIRSKADLDIQDAEGKTALMWAVIRDSLKMVTALIQAEANVNLKTKRGGTALSLCSMSAGRWRIEILKVLIPLVDLNVQNADGKTVLWQAIANQHKPCFDILMKAGADVDIPDKNGVTGLMLAIYKSKYYFNSLMQANANVHKIGNDGNTALMWASKNGNVSYVLALIEAKAELDVRNVNGDTALMLARNENHTRCVEILIKAGANTTGCDHYLTEIANLKKEVTNLKQEVEELKLVISKKE